MVADKKNQKHSESRLCGGFNGALPGQFQKDFEAKLEANEKAELVKSDTVRLILNDAFDKNLSSSLKANIENRITNEREIEQKMRKETMRLMKNGVDPNSIDVTTE